jgi:hypothetical protein
MISQSNATMAFQRERIVFGDIQKPIAYSLSITLSVGIPLNPDKSGGFNRILLS